jgi:hypothetical protein
VGISRADLTSARLTSSRQDPWLEARGAQRDELARGAEALGIPPVTITSHRALAGPFRAGSDVRLD